MKYVFEKGFYPNQVEIVDLAFTTDAEAVAHADKIGADYVWAYTFVAYDANYVWAYTEEVPPRTVWVRKTA